MTGPRWGIVTAFRRNAPCRIERQFADGGYRVRYYDTAGFYGSTVDLNLDQVCEVYSMPAAVDHWRTAS